MPKISPNNITSLSQDWSNDEQTGLPFSGAAVQQFIKSYLGSIARATYFDPTSMTLYYFASEEDRQAFIDNPQLTRLVLFSTGITFSSDLYRIALTNNNNSTTLNVATNQTEINLSIDFEVQTKAVTDTSWHATNSGVIATAYVDVGSIGEYEQISEPTVYTAGQTFILNVRNLIAAGSNRVRINFVNEDDDSITTSITYTINMTEMFIEPLNNNWFTPIVEGGDASNYKLGGYRIVGAINKTLHIDIYNHDSKIKEFTYALGTAAYDQVPFNYISSMGFDLSTDTYGNQMQTGTYLVSAYLTSGTGNSMITSAPVNYNIMYIAASDAYTAQLICINNVADSVYNYTTSRMFDYAIYNRGSMTGSPTIEILQITGTTPHTFIQPTTLNDVPTATLQSYEIDLQWLTEETLNLFVRANMTFGNQQTTDVPMDNSNTFPPTPGYIFYLNCSTRSNSESNYLNLINSKDDREYTPEWQKMTWVEGVDGWITDDIQRKALYIRAGSKMILPYSQYRFIPGDGITLEFCYRISNVSNYDETVISIVNDLESVGFTGIKIKPTNILVHSSEDSTSNNDVYRGTNLMDEEVVYFALSLYPNFKGNQGKNLATGYINGCKAFQFEYKTGAIWGTDGNLEVGAEHSDVSLYFIRLYNSVLSDANIQANYINSLKDVNERKDLSLLLSSVMDANNTNIDYESVKNSGKNFFVVEMLNGATVPSNANGWSKEDKARCNLEMHYGEHSDWDWKLYNLEIAGQGTTSMNYYRWNLRWRIDKTDDTKKVPVSYLSQRTSRAGSYEYTWTEPESSKTVVFDGNGNHPAVKRITAKINSASSMQSHKIGATRAYTELHDAIGISNDAQEYASSNNLPRPTVAVYQYPAYGFAKNGNNYSFIGLFTIGPDKGDKPTFGYDIKDNSKNINIPAELITLEGTDHARKLVMFNQPWNSDVKYLASNECINIVLGTNSYDNGWEVGNCYDLSTDKASDQDAIQIILEREFKPGYDLTFYNSTLILPIALGQYGNTATDTINAINNNITNFIATVDPYGRTSMQFYQLWVENDYDLYYYDLKSNSYLPTGRNLVTEHGTPVGETLEEKNEWFKLKRRERFKASAENYWDIHDACYHYVFMMISGSMDNFGKNSYPVKMKSLANGGRFGWRQDDLDSMAGIGNLGADTMPTWMEFQDSNNGSPYFGGSQSVFWNLIHECYMDDYTSTTTGSVTDGIISTGKAVLLAMASIAGTGGGTLSGIMNYIKSRFWDNAQNYFPQSAYNADAAFKYETAWLDSGYGGISLIQSLGNHYSAEYYWFYKRMIYMMSFFKVGPFGDYSDTSLGRINFRALNWLNPTVTPATPLYPALADGTSVETTSRTWAGEPHTFYGSYGQGQTDMSIMATNTLSDLGDWKDVHVAPGYEQNIIINGSKLIKFKLGDENAYTDEIKTPAVYYTQEEIENAVEGDDAYGKTTEDIKTPAEYVDNVTTNISSVSFQNTNCLEEIDARNVDTLSGSLDITNCKRLKNAYFDGTSLTQIRFANGQPIEKLSLPSTLQSLSMKNIKTLTSEYFELPENLSNITLLQVEHCGIDSIDLLYRVYNSDNSSLRYISTTIDGIEHIDYNDLEILSGLATNKDKDGNDVEYHGVTVDGAPAPTAKPNIIGTIQLDTPFYMSTFTNLGMDESQELDYGTDGLKINRIGNLGSLDLIYDPNEVYINFEDPEVARICISKWGDGNGITTEMAAKVTGSQFGTTFNGNKDISSFNEFKYFTGITALGSNAFRDSNITRITLPSSLKIRSDNATMFYNCKKLEELHYYHRLTLSNSNTAWFYGCNSLTKLYCTDFEQYMSILPNQIKAYTDSFPFRSNSGTHYIYFNNEEVLDLVIPNTITIIYAGACYRWNRLRSVTIPNTVKEIGGDAFNGCTGLTDLTIPFGINNTSIVSGSGNGTGTLRIMGNMNANGYDALAVYYKNMIIDGNYSRTTSPIHTFANGIETLRVKGNFTNSSTNTSYKGVFVRPSGTSGTSRFKFLEIGGTVTATSYYLFNADTAIANNFIMHLGYSGIAGTPTVVNASYAKIVKIYVGPGESEAGDQAILDQYLADTDWAAYSAKLDTWWNYYGEYREPVSDGLVFHLDGMYKGSDSNYWTDRIAGIKFSLTNATTSDNSVVTSANIVADGENCYFNSSEMTIHVVYKGFNANNVIFGNNTNARSFIDYNSTTIYPGNGLIKNKTFTAQTTHIITSNYNKNAVFDLIAQTLDSSTYRPVNVTSGNMYLGNGYEFYDIKIWNRNLTEEEMLKVQQFDKNKYNITL